MKKLLLILFLIIIISVFIDAVFIEPNMSISVFEDLYLPEWDNNLNGLKIAVVSDLHVGTHFVNLDKISKIKEIVNKQNPDLIIFPGDFDAMAIAHSKVDRQKLSGLLSAFDSGYGNFAVCGNHDYYPANIVRPLLKKSNINLLENSSVVIYLNGTPLKIAGTKDLYYYPDAAEYASTVNGKNIPVILVSHNPDVFPDVQNTVALTIAGHTHGGEFNLPIIGSPTVPSDYFQRFRKGYIIENNKHLYVSGGIATLSRLRFCNPPEIVFLRLFSQSTDNKITEKHNLNILKINILIPVQKIIKHHDLSNPLAF